MTREEQINLYLKERNIPITSLEANSIIEGITWADEHPYLSEEEQVGMGGLGMMWQQQALIKKACEWLGKILYIHTEVEEDKHWGTTKSYDYITSDHDSIGDFINDFREAMEE